MTRPPVVLFVYKRPEHTQSTLEALARCWGASETDLVIFSDGPKTPSDQVLVQTVRALCRSALGFRSVTLHEAPFNRGLAASVIKGVSQVLSTAASCVVLEDDLVVAPGFLDFMNAGLSAYEGQQAVFSLSGYAPPPQRVPVPSQGSVWFAPRPSSWGWAIWKDRWDLVDWSVKEGAGWSLDRTAVRRFERGGRDLSYFLRLQLAGKLDSWAVRLAWTQCRLDRWTVYPDRSFVDNTGLDGTGTHSRKERGQQIDLNLAQVPSLWPVPHLAHPGLMRAFRRHYEGTWIERWRIRWQKLNRMITEEFRGRM